MHSFMYTNALEFENTTDLTLAQKMKNGEPKKLKTDLAKTSPSSTF